MGRARVLFLAMLAAPSVGQLSAQNPTAVLDVTYVEVGSGSEPSAAALLKRHREAGRQAPGNAGLEVLRQRDRPDHFVFLESWRDQASLDQHRANATTTAFIDALEALQVSAVDQRLFKNLAVGAPAQTPPTSAVYVVTHVDTIPNPQRDATALLKRHAEESRSDEGNLAFDVYQQTNRSNHFAIVEIWKDGSALARHASVAHSKRYRDELQPLLGSPIDERVFAVVR